MLLSLRRLRGCLQLMPALFKRAESFTGPNRACVLALLLSFFQLLMRR